MVLNLMSFMGTEFVPGNLYVWHVQGKVNNKYWLILMIIKLEMWHWQ